jgi:ElaB/YqjD/DUF883 family membrane-anchored ribosome-binding protein
MAETQTRSLQQIQRETEHTRAGLTQTVDELRHTVAETATDLRERISPAAIKAEVSHYVRSRGEQLLDDITDAARKNPMQAVAVGASVAYPMLRLARVVPMPIWMIGAGLFLAGSKTGKAASERATGAASDLADEVVSRIQDARAQLGNAAASVASYATGGVDRLSDSASDLADRANSALSAAKETGASATGGVRDAVSSAATSMADRTAEVKDQGGRLITRAGNTIEENPLVLAGFGLLIGGLLAGSLPRSDLETDLVGETGSAIKRRARTAASGAVETAANAVSTRYEQAAKRAADEGLDADGVADAVRDIGGRVRRVAETAVTAAFEPSEADGKQGHQTDVREGEHHG